MFLGTRMFFDKRPALPVFLLGAALLSCKATPPASDSDVEADVVVGDVAPGTDVPDVRADIQPDVPADDVRPDTGSDDPEWEALPGLPDGCTVERANHPEHLLRNEWIECGEGCEYLARDERFQRVVGRSTGWHDGERGYFSVVEGRLTEPEPARHRIVTLVDTEGTVWGGWRGAATADEGACRVSLVSAGDNFAFITVVVFLGDIEAVYTRETHVYAAPITEIGCVTEPIAVLGRDVVPAGSGLSRPSNSASLLVAELQPGSRLLLVQPDGEWQIYAEEEVQGPRVVGNDVYLEGLGAPFRRIMRMRFGEEPSVMVEHADAHSTGLGMDGTTLSWQVARGGSDWVRAERIELWASPLPTSSTPLVPRLVRLLTPDLHSTYAEHFGGSGYVARQLPGTFVRLADGATTAWPLNGDNGVGGNNGYLWISADEVATSAQSTGVRPSFGTIVRTRHDSMRDL